MGKTIHIPYYLTAAAGASGTVSLYTVPGGQKLKITRIVIRFESGTDGKLQLAFKAGIKQVAPVEGKYFAGENVTLNLPADIEYYPDSSIDLYYNNTDPGSSHSATIVLVGTLE